LSSQGFVHLIGKNDRLGLTVGAEHDRLGSAPLSSEERKDARKSFADLGKWADAEDCR
jgi:hypothetical protein